MEKIKRQKRIKTDSDRKRNFKHKEKTVLYLKCAGFAVFAFLLAKTKLLGSLSPVSLSLCAAAPNPYCAFAALGCAGGYILSFSGTASVRYVCCLAGVLLIKSAINRFGEGYKNGFLMPISAMLCCASTGLAVMLAQGFSLNGFTAFFCECAVTGMMTYFFDGFFKRASMKDNLLLPENSGSIYLFVTLCSVLMVFAPYSFFDFNPARAAAIFLILIFSFLLGESGGALSGIAMGIGLGSACEYLPLGGLYPVIGLVCGMLSRFSQLAIALCAVTICGVHAVILPSAKAVAIIAESAVASLIFVFLPRERLLRLKNEKSREEVKKDTEKKQLLSRIRDSQSALKGTYECLSGVSRDLSKIDGDITDLIDMRVRQTVCCTCPKAEFCKNNRASKDAFLSIIRKLSSKRNISRKDLPKDFLTECEKSEKIVACFNRIYADLGANITANAKNNDLRRVIADGFLSMSDILGEIGADLEKEKIFLPTASQKAQNAFKDKNYNILSCECIKNEEGRIVLTAALKSIGENEKYQELLKSIRQETGIAFSYPTVKLNGANALLTFCQRCAYRVSFGTFQQTGGESSLCGDSFAIYKNQKGFDTAVLSDGMGTGGRAAVDSAMTVSLFEKLTSSGMSFKTSLKIINAALLSKSQEETLSTLDVFLFDPFCAEGQFFKAGSAPTFLMRDGEVKIIKDASLPAGILRNIRFSSVKEQLLSGDTVVMLSDGVLCDDNSWLENLLLGFNGNEQELAEKIAETAREKQCGNKKDDLTVITAKIELI